MTEVLLPSEIIPKSMEDREENVPAKPGNCPNQGVFAICVDRTDAKTVVIMAAFSGTCVIFVNMAELRFENASKS